MKPTSLLQQCGAVLLTALIFLVVLTLLGIGVYATTTSEEKMARNFRDKKIALQAAEAALNEAIILITASYIDPNGTNPAPRQMLTSDNCPSTIDGFICEPTGITDYKTYDLFASTAKYANLGSKHIPNVSPSPAFVVPGDISEQPRYLIILEKDSSMCGPSNITPYCFRILAQAKGRLSTTRVNLIEQFAN